MEDSRVAQCEIEVSVVEKRVGAAAEKECSAPGGFDGHHVVVRSRRLLADAELLRVDPVHAQSC